MHEIFDYNSIHCQNNNTTDIQFSFGFFGLVNAKTTLAEEQ